MSELVLHIGLGKCATTSLQYDFFPAMCQRNNIIYNPELFEQIRRKKFIYSNEDKRKLNSIIYNKNTLISAENLVEWNPRNWDLGIKRILDLFGNKAHIVITVRDPLEYLTSTYVQRIHNGSVISPYDFFLSKQEYDLLDPHIPKRSLWRFDKDSFDLNYLISLYEKEFDSVYILPTSMINTLYPWIDIFHFPKEEIEALKNDIHNLKNTNRSYSEKAVKWTFIREYFLNLTEKQSVHHEDWRTNKNIFDNTDIMYPFNKISSKKINKVSKKVRKRIKQWRWLMQEGVDKYFPYKKYTLPNDIHFNEDLMDKNRQLVKKYEDVILKIRDINKTN